MCRLTCDTWWRWRGEGRRHAGRLTCHLKLGSGPIGVTDMAFSGRQILGSRLGGWFTWPKTPGPLGINDQSDPFNTSLVGDSPGPIGRNDSGTPFTDWSNDFRTRAPILGPDGELLFPGIGDEKCYKSPAPKSNAPVMELRQAQAFALRITAVFEGGFQAVADDTDGQGTSFGVIQWNFGQSTLGPLLKKMLRKDPKAFANCFGPTTNYAVLKKALDEERQPDQIKWARDLLKSDRAAWKAAFKALGAVPDFVQIQRDQAIAEYHPLVVKSIATLREFSEELMRDVEFRTYAALFDLCVQQHGIKKQSKSGTELVVPYIEARIRTEKPDTQFALVSIAVVERAKRAAVRWVSDCISRRMGILTGGAYASTENQITAKRANHELQLIADWGTHVVQSL